MEEEHEHKKEKLDVEGELGISRRDMLRRGAIVGGTLVWVAPAIQSIGSKALAQSNQGPSPGTCAACYCFSGPITDPEKAFGTVNGVAPFGGLFSEVDCRNWCRHSGPYEDNGAPNGPYASQRYCSGTTECHAGQQGGVRGAFCS